MCTRLFFRKPFFKFYAVFRNLKKFWNLENGFGTFARLHADKNL